MITREAYMKKIRPFINSDLVKVLTGIRRCGKSVRAYKTRAASTRSH